MIPSLDIIYLDLLAMACTVIGVVVFIENIKFACNGSPIAMRWYMAVKGVIALFAAFVYLLTCVDYWNTLPPSTMMRTLMVLLLLLMLLDSVIRALGDKPPQTNVETKGDD